jgi:hypothetical protein
MMVGDDINKMELETAPSSSFPDLVNDQYDKNGSEI